MFPRNGGQLASGPVGLWLGEIDTDFYFVMYLRGDGGANMTMVDGSDAAKIRSDADGVRSRLDAQSSTGSWTDTGGGSVSVKVAMVGDGRYADTERGEVQGDRLTMHAGSDSYTFERIA